MYEITMAKGIAYIIALIIIVALAYSVPRKSR